MFFGQNRLYIACVEHNFLLEFSPIDSLLCCKFSEQKARMLMDKEDAAPAIKDHVEVMEDTGS
jgi:hypothetical protein